MDTSHINFIKIVRHFEKYHAHHGSCDRYLAISKLRIGFSIYGPDIDKVIDIINSFGELIKECPQPGNWLGSSIHLGISSRGFSSGIVTSVTTATTLTLAQHAKEKHKGTKQKWQPPGSLSVPDNKRFEVNRSRK